MQLFCFPFAGGASSAYRGLQTILGKDIDVVPVDLPGHGRRIAEPLLDTLPEMVDDLWGQMRARLDAPCLFFGHSMGALLAYLLAYRMQTLNMQLPVHLFCAGCRAPSLGPERRDRHGLPRAAFVSLLKEMGGCPDEILSDPDALSFFEPIIRADLQAIETFEFVADLPLRVPVTVMVGADDTISSDDTDAWDEDVEENVDRLVLSGNHFFIFDHWPVIGRRILDVVDIAYETH